MRSKHFERRPWQFSLRTLLLATALGPPAVWFTDLALTPVLCGTNCGGNSAALSACGAFVSIMSWWAKRHPGQPGFVDQLDAQTTQMIWPLPGADWVRSAKFLVRETGIKIGETSRDVVIVCDKPYSNVPQHLLWNAPSMHAVGYADGTTGLISPREFERLDLTEFVDLAMLVSATSGS